jgi:hypothetical protein
VANELRPAAGLRDGSADQADMVLFESDSWILRETVRIGMEGLQKTFNLSADLSVLGPSPVSRTNLTALGLYFHNTPPCIFPPASAETSWRLAAGDNRGF